VGDVWSGIADISVHLAHDANVLVAVEQRVLVVPRPAQAAAAAVRGLVGLKASIGKNDDEPFGVFVGYGDWKVLLRDQLR
jgi:hypothetical protein